MVLLMVFVMTCYFSLGAARRALAPDPGASVNANDGNRTGEWMDESGAHGTRRGARRLARFPSGSGGIVKWIRPRVWNMVAPGLLVTATPGIGRGMAPARRRA